MVVAAAVIMQVGKVEVHAMPDVPPPYIRMFKPKRMNFLAEPEPSPYATLDIETIELRYHRMVGLSVLLAYWPDSWQDDWAIEELLKWEGRGDEIRRDQYYADFIVDENQQARENEHRQIERGHTGERPRTFVVHESVREPRVDSGPAVLGRAESDSYLRLERGISGEHETNLSGKDED